MIKDGAAGFTVILLSAVFFLYLFGLSFIDPSHYSWLLTGDSSIFFYGFNFFNQETWMHPLGKILSYSYPESSSIVYTDSIPLAALFSKLFFHGKVFQFTGIWTLLCFLLQGGLSFVLLRKNRVSFMNSVFGSLLYLTLPTFLNRTEMDTKHYSLLSQFFVLMGMYGFTIESAKKNLRFWWVTFALSMSVHLYFSFIIGFFFFLSHTLTEIMSLLRSRRFYGSLVGLGIIAYELGYFQIPIQNSTAGGFGAYSFSLTGLFSSMGRSALFPTLQTVNEYHEGYQYLGLGIILLLLLTLAVSKTRRLFNEEVRTSLQSHWVLLAALFTLAATFQFSFLQYRLAEWVSFPILFSLYFYFRKKEGTKASQVILEFALLCFAIFACGKVFRATGRLFWPLSYLLIFYLLKSKPKSWLLALLVLLQLADLKPFLTEIKENNETLSQIIEPKLDSFSADPSRFDHIAFLGGFYIPPAPWFHYALIHQKSMSPLPVARASSTFRSEEKKALESDIQNLQFKPRTLYLIGNEKIATELQKKCHINPSLCSSFQMGVDAQLTYVLPLN